MTASPPGSEWFASARLGMFVHWGHSSQQGVELSWPITGGVDVLPHSRPAMAVGDYESSAATFDPVPGSAKEWAALARSAGMTYGVFTARHHDGYSMWPTALSDYSVATSPSKPDLVGEFVDAFRTEGLRVGLYYSLPDWHHPDYPALTDADRPYQFGLGRRSPPAGWQRYVDYVFGQIEELLTGYGQIDVMWFDGAWERSDAEWQVDALAARIRELQPAILINDRLPRNGDFLTPEQFVPAEPPSGLWETCLTMNDSWGYVPDDHAYKPARQLVETVCETAARGGNLLLNVSPRGDGSLPPEQLERLALLAAWMQRHGSTIVDTQPGLAPWQWYGPSTERGDHVFLHLLTRPYDTVVVRGVPVRRVRSATIVGTGMALASQATVSVIDQIVHNADPRGELRLTVPPDAVDSVATVIDLHLASPVQELS